MRRLAPVVCAGATAIGFRLPIASPVQGRSRLVRTNRGIAAGVKEPHRDLIDRAACAVKHSQLVPLARVGDRCRNRVQTAKSKAAAGGKIKPRDLLATQLRRCVRGICHRPERFVGRSELGAVHIRFVVGSGKRINDHRPVRNGFQRPEIRSVHRRHGWQGEARRRRVIALRDDLLPLCDYRLPRGARRPRITLRAVHRPQNPGVDIVLQSDQFGGLLMKYCIWAPRARCKGLSAAANLSRQTNAG